ncbi:MAG: helix-hairpin-helix domain-containing protein [Caldilineae bacterium]|nr:helix-hairpin-helix domain-containing protein [Caldilineae bacterium]
MGRIDINTAGIEEMTRLPGMTRALAEAVVRHRDVRGLFLTVSELAAVDGIDESLAGRIAEAGAFAGSTAGLGYEASRNRILSRAGLAR